MAIDLNWKTLPLGEIAWALFWIAVAINWLIDPEVAFPFETVRGILFYVLAWFLGVVLLKFVKKQLKPKSQNDLANEKNTILGLPWWNTGEAISHMPVNGWLSAFIALWSINSFVAFIGAFVFLIGLFLDLDVGLSMVSIILLFSYFSVLAASMFYSLYLLIKKKAAAIPFTQNLLLMNIVSGFAYYAGSRVFHTFGGNVSGMFGSLLFIYYLYQSKQIEATFPPYARKLFWFDKLFLVIVAVILTLFFLGLVLLPDISKFME
ncbi:MAG: hypothetical protein Q7K34_03360 [archaeon]|nr:hypothetical protein [archaeon]